jgi:hypothetical protein
MSASGPVNYGTLKHGALRSAQLVLVDGERVRPHYLGKLVDFRRKPGLLESRGFAKAGRSVRMSR